MNMRKLLIFTLLFIPFITIAEKKDVVELFKEGNEKYKKGKYEDAIKFYESILAKGLKNGYIYYNLGNAYFKAEMLGKAILNYERAIIYLSSDPDVVFSLKFANSRKTDRIQKQQYNPFTKIVLFFYNLFRINTLFWLVYVIFLILIASLILKWFYKNINYQVIIQKVLNYGGIIFLVFLFILIIKINEIKSSVHAVIIISEVKVKSGPSEDYTDVFALHEGTKIKIRKETDPWILITLPNRFSGWVEKDCLEKI